MSARRVFTTPHECWPGRRATHHLVVTLSKPSHEGVGEEATREVADGPTGWSRRPGAVRLLEWPTTPSVAARGASGERQAPSAKVRLDRCDSTPARRAPSIAQLRDLAVDQRVGGSVNRFSIPR